VTVTTTSDRCSLARNISAGARRVGLQRLLAAELSGRSRSVKRLSPLNRVRIQAVNEPLTFGTVLTVFI